MYASLSLNDLNVFIEIATYHSLYYMYSLRKEFLIFQSNKDASQIHQLPVCSFHIRPLMRSYDVWLILNLEIFFEKRSIYLRFKTPWRSCHVTVLNTVDEYSFGEFDKCSKTPAEEEAYTFIIICLNTTIEWYLRDCGRHCYYSETCL